MQRTVSLTPAKEHTFPRTLNSWQREQSSNLTWLRLLFQKYRKGRRALFLKKMLDLKKSLLHIIPLLDVCIFSITQNWTALAGTGTQSAQCFAVQTQPL